MLENQCNHWAGFSSLFYEDISCRFGYSVSVTFPCLGWVGFNRAWVRNLEIKVALFLMQHKAYPHASALPAHLECGFPALRCALQQCMVQGDGCTYSHSETFLRGRGTPSASPTYCDLVTCAPLAGKGC